MDGPSFSPARRRMLRAGLAAGPLFLPVPYALVWAQSEGALRLMRLPKLALVMGNSNYKEAPLRNPANDARALGGSLKQIGFEVTMRLDAGREEMLKTIRAYVQELAKRKCVGMFYFAGHGVQLAWRNYLLPTDALIDRIEDIQKQAVDLASLIEGITRAANPMNVIVLDACRDNPFGSARRLDQKGLSQMDAPPGTFLAYATAPGNVASDGDGANGLYTEHLLKEIAVPEAKVEDVFKRVRLHVRRRTNGLQIPWESTSLEEDFWFVPPRSLSTLADEEAERERQREMALREKRRAEEAAARKRKHELALKEAQRVTEEAERRREEERVLREARLAEAEAARKHQQELALREKQLARDAAERRRKQEPAPGRKPDADLENRQFEEELALWERIKESKEPGPLEDYLLRHPSGRYSELAQFQLDRVLARLGEKKIEITSSEGNPFTKGTARIDTNFKIGDSYSYREIDLYTKIETRTFTNRVTGITDTEVIFNDGLLVTDLFGNSVKLPKGNRFTGAQFFIPEYSVGKKWATRFKVTAPTGATGVTDYEFRVVAREQVSVPAGTFEAYKVEGQGWGPALLSAVGGSINLQTLYWIAPGIKRAVAREDRRTHSRGKVLANERQELIAYTQS